MNTFLDKRNNIKQEFKYSLQIKFKLENFLLTRNIFKSQKDNQRSLFLNSFGLISCTSLNFL